MPKCRKTNKNRTYVLFLREDKYGKLRQNLIVSSIPALSHIIKKGKKTMKYEDALYALFGNDLMLRHKIKNKRRLLSDKIMQLETKAKLTQEQAAQAAHIPLVYLLEMENVNLKVPVNEYLLVIQKLKAYMQQQAMLKSQNKT